MQNTNLHSILNDIDWLQTIINHVIGSYLKHEGVSGHWTSILPPDNHDSNTPYTQFINTHKLNIYDRLTLALAMASHFKPEVLDIFLGKNKMYDRGFTEFGGVIDHLHSGFLPTGQTLLFLIAATKPELREEATKCFQPEHIFTKEHIISLQTIEDYLPKYNGVLSISRRWLHYFLEGEMPNLEQSSSFSAKQIQSPLEWDDIVLSNHVMDQVLELRAWLTHGKTLMNEWQLAKKIKAGYRALFYGPPGTGKTLTATLLGKVTNRPVYRVDLSMIVSKYIGETEKNLAKIFDIAQHKDWILFFDEADALFGKRTEANTSNDRHANQQTSFLLQRIEDFPGTIILASNLKANMDAAFTRRFQAMIHFSIPSADERLILWQNAFSGTCTLGPNINLKQIAKNYELAGGAISNVLRYCALSAISKNTTVVSQHDLLNGIKTELKKEHKTMTPLN